MSPGLALPAEVPVELGRQAAQEAAREELARQVYREAGPGLTERVVAWLYDRLTDALHGVAGVSPGGYAGVVVLLLVVVAAVVAVRMRTGPLGRRAGREQSLFVGQDLTADEHRARADAHAAAAEWAEALRERLRAVVRSLEERAILEPRPGRTADEAAAEGAVALPSCAVALRDAAHLFDDVWYGGRPAGPDADRALRELDQAVRAARPATLPRVGGLPA